MRFDAKIGNEGMDGEGDGKGDGKGEYETLDGLVDKTMTGGLVCCCCC